MYNRRKIMTTNKNAITTRAIVAISKRDELRRLLTDVEVEDD